MELPLSARISFARLPVEKVPSCCILGQSGKGSCPHRLMGGKPASPLPHIHRGRHESALGVVYVTLKLKNLATSVTAGKNILIHRGVTVQGDGHLDRGIRLLRAMERSTQQCKVGTARCFEFKSLCRTNREK